MKLYKKILALILALALALSLSACAGGNKEKKLVVGASPAPHAEILEFVKPILAEQGITLEIQEFTDYVLPNQALDAGDLDANYFQHYPYLENFNQNNKTNLVSAAAIHFEPLGIYAGKSADLSAIPDGATVSIPNDATNEARALQLLAAQGIITLPEGAGLNVTARDVKENPHNLEFLEIAAEQVPRTLVDVDFAVANGNYALEAGITDKLLVTEEKDSEGAQTYANIVAVRAGDENREEIKALIAALQSEETRAFITEKYGANVIPVF
jgi:D-methionine transport system substrate-binding protein